MDIVTQAFVVDKNINNGKGDYADKVYYNVTLGEPQNLNGMTIMNTQIIGVPEDVYNKIEVGKVNRLGGSFGGLKTKWWKFDKFHGIVEEKSK